VNEEEAQIAYTKLQFLREDLGRDAPSLQNITLEKLRRSKVLRNFLLDTDFDHFMLTEFPRGALDKELTKVEMIQSLKQTQMMKEAKSVLEVNLKNVERYEEYKKGEEGIDYVKYAPG